MMVFKNGIQEVRMEGIRAAIIPYLTNSKIIAYCMNEDAMDILKKRKRERCYSSFTGSYLMGSEIIFTEFFKVSRDIFQPINFSSNSSL
jgi:hypothetical protein